MSDGGADCISRVTITIMGMYPFLKGLKAVLLYHSQQH